MAITDVLGLFASPQQYAAQQAAAEQNRAINFAGLDPRQQANYGVFLGAQQLGRGLAGLFGAEDPQLRMISQRQQIMQSINPADPESLLSGIQRATEMGDQQLALTLTDYRNRQMSEMALAQQRKAQAERESGGIEEAARINAITMELSNLDPENAEDKPKYDALVAERTRLERQAKGRSGDKFTQLQDLYAQRKKAVNAGNDQDVQIIDRLINSLAPEKGGAKQIEKLAIADEIVNLEKQIRNAKDDKAPAVLDAKVKLDVLRSQLKGDKSNLTVVGEVKSGVDKGKAVYVDETNDQQFVYDFKDGKQVRKPFVGDVDRITSQVTATATSSARLPPGVNEVVTGLGKLDVEDMKTARENKRAAVASNQALKKLRDLDNAGLISGSFAPSRVGVANFLSTLGVLSSADKGRLATSQQYEKVGADLVFQSLQGKLGPGVSEGDRLFIERLFPRLETDPTARRELIQYLADKNNAVIKETDAAEAYLRKNKSFEGYTPQTSGVFDIAPNKLKTMSNDELQKAYEAARKKER